MDTELLKKYINEYKSNFDFVHQQEIYKWKAVKQFQDNWNLEAPDFYSMVENSLKSVDNLLNAGNYFPKRMLLKNIQKEPEKIRTLFEYLYDEEFGLFERIEYFQSEFKKINSKNYNGKKDYQDPRAIIVYLTLRYPDRYFFYKFTMFKDFSEKINFTYTPKKGRLENIGQFQNLCNLIKYELSKDQELLKIHKNRITDDCYYDENLNILTQDFIYAVAKHLSYRQTPKKENKIQTKISKINSQEIKTKHTNLDFTPKIINHIQNNIDNKRIGDLGELWVIDEEKKKLLNANKPKLAEKVEHISKDKGDGIGYDILSYDKNGNKLLIEVKTTKGNVNNTFYVTRNELEQSKINSDNYYLYRVYDFNEEKNTGKILIIKGDLSNLCQVPLTYKVNINI